MGKFMPPLTLYNAPINVILRNDMQMITSCKHNVTPQNLKLFGQICYQLYKSKFFNDAFQVLN